MTYPSTTHRSKVTLTDAVAVTPDASVDVMASDRALEALTAADPRKAHVVELRFFGGLSVEETAEVQHFSTDTIKRDWRLAKLWLVHEMAGRAR